MRYPLPFLEELFDDAVYLPSLEVVFVWFHMDSEQAGTVWSEFVANIVEGMMIREQGESTSYCVSFQTITGFTYERGHEYELLVKRTTLANPPQDSGKYRYELVRIVSDKKIE